MDELKNKKILLVDDEKELLKTTEEVLRSEGFFNIYTAASCEVALQIVKTQPIALLLLDVMLPDGDGFSLFEKLRQITQAPVIFLTAVADKEHIAAVLGLNPAGYFLKPLEREKVLEKVAQVLQE